MKVSSRLALLCGTAALSGLGPLKAQQPVPVRTLAPVVTTDSGVLRTITGVRHLQSGRVLVNDFTRRRLLMLDSTLTTFTIIADTAVGAANAYGVRPMPGGLIPYLGDSTLFVNVEAQAFLVIDPAGKMTRTMAPPRPSDLTYIAQSFYGLPGFDPQGRLFYRTARRSPGSTAPPQLQPGKIATSVSPDSAPILRSNLDTRAVDTVAMMRIPVQKSIMMSPQPNSWMSTSMANPLPSTDEWALLPDGTIAIVRGQDYHVDWLQPDGTRISSPKMPFDWKRITLEEKQQMLDSLVRMDAERRAKLPPRPPVPPGQFDFGMMPYKTVNVADLPDFYPPIRSGQVKADPEGNLWILPSTSVAAKDGLLYDVVNRKGEVFERVQLPKGRSLVGFGPGGIVYMTNPYTGTGGTRLERARVLR